MHRDRRVAFLARDLVWADESGGVLAFSYAARKLEASLRSAEDLRDVETTVIDLRTDDEEAFLERIRAFRPSVVAASTFIWSIGVFTRLAAKVRAWDPSVRFVLGGPAARPSVLALAPYAPHVRAIDAVVTGEGEEVIRRIARAHAEPGWQATVPGLTVPGPLGFRKTADIERPELDAYASPYQLDIVPRGGNGYLETFRGCPISCAFCQWGVEKADRVHSTEYLASHLRGIDRAGTESVYVTDAGFNLSARAFRNLRDAEREVGALAKRQVLGHIYPTHLREEHLELFDRFGRAEITVGVQSFDEAVLERLGRPFDLERFERVLGELDARGVAVDLELILGLPGDVPANFRRTFEKAIGLASSVRVFYCLALPDALLERADDLAVDFDPETFEVRACAGWSAESLRAEWARVRRVAETMYRPNFGPNWIDFKTAHPSPDRERVHTLRTVAPETVDRLRDAVAGAAMGWRLADARADGPTLVLDLDGASGRLVLEVRRAEDGERWFAEHDGIAYSHRGELVQDDTPKLRSFIERVHRDVRPALPPAPAS
jgi:radical SAM superfamily enzyme YgiQ (UPF0313 family)